MAARPWETLPLHGGLTSPSSIEATLSLGDGGKDATTQLCILRHPLKRIVEHAHGFLEPSLAQKGVSQHGVPERDTLLGPAISAAQDSRSRRLSPN